MCGCSGDWDDGWDDGAVLMYGGVGAVVMWDDGWGDGGCSDDVG